MFRSVAFEDNCFLTKCVVTTSHYGTDCSGPYNRRIIPAVSVVAAALVNSVPYIHKHPFEKCSKMLPTTLPFTTHVSHLRGSGVLDNSLRIKYHISIGRQVSSIVSEST